MSRNAGEGLETPLITPEMLAGTGLAGGAIALKGLAKFAPQLLATIPAKAGSRIAAAEAAEGVIGSAPPYLRRLLEGMRGMMDKYYIPSAEDTAKMSRDLFNEYIKRILK